MARLASSSPTVPAVSFFQGATRFRWVKRRSACQEYTQAGKKSQGCCAQMGKMGEARLAAEGRAWRLRHQVRLRGLPSPLACQPKKLAPNAAPTPVGGASVGPLGRGFPPLAGNLFPRHAAPANLSG